MSELEFPELDTAAPAATTALAEQPAGAVDLAKLDLQAVALAAFGPAHAAVAAATKTLTGVEHDLSTPTKLADAKSLRHRLINVPLADARKVSAGLKSKLTAVSRAVGAELTAIETAFQTAESLITPQIDAAQAKLDEEARIRREAEAARVQKHRDNLAKLAEPAERCRQPGMTAERIANGIAAVSAIVIDRAAWEDFADQAEEQKAVTLERMQALHAAAVAAEAEAARLAEEKAEQERRAAELQAESDRLAAERAELERARAELAAQQEAAAAAERARADEAARQEREQREEAERQAQCTVFQPVTPKESESPKSHPTHGYSYTPEYRAWQAMCKRCTDPENARWPDYGGRGITVCDRWLNDVAAFMEDMGKKPSDEHELDRIDNDMGYGPENCRWVLRSENNRNKRNNRLVEWNGQEKTLAEWCEITGLPFSTLKWRLDSGWAVERAMTEGAEPDATDRDAPASTSPSVGSMGEGQPADAGPAAASEVVQLHAAPAALEPHMLKLGELWDILGLTDREAFLAGLGFPATPAAKGTGKLYAQSALPSICRRISEHFAELAGNHQKAA